MYVFKGPHNIPWNIIGTKKYPVFHSNKYYNIIPMISNKDVFRNMSTPIHNFRRHNFLSQTNLNTPKFVLGQFSVFGERKWPRGRWQADSWRLLPVAILSKQVTKVQVDWERITQGIKLIIERMPKSEEKMAVILGEA